MLSLRTSTALLFLSIPAQGQFGSVLPQKINVPPYDNSVSDFVSSRDGSLVLFYSEGSENSAQFFTAKASDTIIQPLQTPPAEQYRVRGLTSNNSHVLYWTRETAGSQRILHSSSLDGTGFTNHQIPEQDFLVFEDESTFYTTNNSLQRFTADNLHFITQADLNQDERFELYSFPLNGGPPIRIDTHHGSIGNIHDFTSSPDGSTFIYRADDNDDLVLDYYVSSADGSPPN